jgi:hypothetical protein
MTLVSSIIRDAYRETNLIPLAREVTVDQEIEALRLLNQVIAGLYGSIVGERLTDWPLGRYALDHDRYDHWFNIHWFREGELLNRRMIATNEEARTVHLAQRPQDGSRMAFVDPYSRASQAPVTIDGNGRPIEGADSIVMDVDGESREWMYRADLGQWVRLTNLQPSDLLPFPERFDQFFSISLAMRLNPRNGLNLDEQSALVWRQQRRDLINEYLQSLPLVPNPSLSWPFMSVQSYGQGRYSDSTGFNRGLVG